jgi:hypothetical protein
VLQHPAVTGQIILICHSIETLMLTVGAQEA